MNRCATFPCVAAPETTIPPLCSRQPLGFGAIPSRDCANALYANPAVSSSTCRGNAADSEAPVHRIGEAERSRSWNDSGPFELAQPSFRIADDTRNRSASRGAALEPVCRTPYAGPITVQSAKRDATCPKTTRSALIIKETGFQALQRRSCQDREAAIPCPSREREELRASRISWPGRAFSWDLFSLLNGRTPRIVGGRPKREETS